jgi:type I restriction enzyme, S subunit
LIAPTGPVQLIAHFDRLVEAPDAIPRLRRFILDLAVRGKLVDQDPDDEPASKLLERFSSRQHRIAWSSGTEEGETAQSLGTDKYWTELPLGWNWTGLGTVAQVLMGQSPPGETYNKYGEGIPLINGPAEFSEGPFGITIVNQYTTKPTNVCEEGDLLLCVRGSTTGRTNVAGFRACIGRGVAAIRPYFGEEYIRVCIWRLRDSIIGMGRGVAFPSVSRQQIEKLPIPIPPLQEQRRIVARVNELMSLCDRLETTQRERESRRDRLAAASLQRLNQPDDNDREEDSRKYASFYLGHLSRVTTRPDQILALRQTIVNSAVRGRLVPQEPSDESSSELLARIHAENQRARSERKVKARSQFPPIDEPVPPFDIPRSWRWAYLGDLALDFRYGTAVKCSYEPTGDPVLRIPNIDNGRINIEDLKFGKLASALSGME